MGGGGEVRQERLYSCLTCAQKRQKCKFVPRLLSMTKDSRPSKLLLLWLVLSPLSASSWNGQVLDLVWCSLRALMALRSPKIVKNYSRKSRWFKNHAKVKVYFTDHEKKSKTSFPRMEKYRFTNHGKNKSSFTFARKAKTLIHASRKKYRGPSASAHLPLGFLYAWRMPTCHNGLFLHR